MPHQYSPLAYTTHAFISAFIANRPASETLSLHFTPTASIHEHGPGWARSRLPFLARTFTGRSPPPPAANPLPTSSSSSASSSNNKKPDNNPADVSADDDDSNTMDTYYALLSSTLEFKPTPHTLPDLDAYAVDEAKGVVSVRLRGGFEAKRKGRADEEGTRKKERRAWTEEWVYLVRFEAQGEGEEEEEEEEEEERKGEEEKRSRKIERLDIWADPLSAWVAMGGGEEGEEEEEKEGG
ncbi:MAG: hypothetical protein Q9210_005322 [Variospora velana]